MHIAISGGGTGGHFFSAITSTEFLKKDFKVSYLKMPNSLKANK